MKKFFSALLSTTAILLFCIIIFYVFNLKAFFQQEEELPNVAQEITEIEKKAVNINPKEDEIIHDTPKDVDTRLTYSDRMKKGNYFLGKGFLSLSTNEFVIASQLEPRKLEPLLKLGNIHYVLGNFEKARTNFEKILELNPNNNDVKVLLGKIYIKKNNFLAAKDYFSSISTQTQEVLYYKALLEILEGNNELAKGLLTQALEQNSQNEVAQNIQSFLNNYSEYELLSDGQEVFLKSLHAKTMNQSKEYEMAVNVLKNVLKSRPEYRDAWILLGYAYLNLEKYDFSLTAFDKAYKLDPEKAETQYFLGVTFYELQKYADAISYFEVALKNGFEPRIQVIQKLADIYVIQEKYELAVASYEQILQLNNSDVNSYIKPIWIYIDFLNQPEKAKELAQKAENVHPENAMTHNLLGWSFWANKQYNDAETELKKALGKNPNFPAAYLNLARIYESRDEREKALENYKKAYDLDNEGSIGTLAAKKYNQLLQKPESQEVTNSSDNTNEE